MEILVFTSIIDLLPSDNTSFNTYEILVILKSFEHHNVFVALKPFHFKIRKPDDEVNLIMVIVLNTASNNGS